MYKELSKYMVQVPYYGVCCIHIADERYLQLVSTKKIVNRVDFLDATSATYFLNAICGVNWGVEQLIDDSKLSFDETIKVVEYLLN